MATYLWDHGRSQVGELAGTEGLNYLLRPVGEGCTWACPPERARVATQAEKLSAQVKAANTAGRWSPR